MQMEMDIARVTKLMRGLVEGMYESSEERGESNLRIDQIGIIGIAAWTTPEGEDVEDGFTAFETKKHHVVSGIMLDILATRFQRVPIE